MMSKPSELRLLKGGEEAVGREEREQRKRRL